MAECRYYREGLEFRVKGLGFRVKGLGSRVQGLGFRAQGSKCPNVGTIYRHWAPM